MSSLVERLRVRSDRRPVYNIDEWDDDADLDERKSGSAQPQQKIEKIVRADAKDDSCQTCGESENLLCCETCTYAYHPKCLLPPLKAPLPSNWRCPECASPLNDIEKILDCEMRPTVADDSDASKLGSKQIFVKQYLVKWKGLSYLHCTWVPEKEFIKAYKAHPRLRTKVNNFHRQMSSVNNSEDDFVAIRPEWTTVDRILACRGDDDEKEYYVKWKELPYDECYWEFESDISLFQQEIERFNKIQSRRRKQGKQKSSSRDATESKKKQREFQQYEQSPGFLSGGSLHPYQLEGLNFLRFSWSKQTHVILADEMGLGKTIQSIAYLASLFEENISPHLVVAPLSTLRNWEREFATWAPQMNVVMYVGSAQARAIIREYEFYFPKRKSKNKKSGQNSGESKQDRIKFDVLLTSYEMINLDSTSLKPIYWESMIVDEGHRLKNKDSKLFSSLKQYSSKHRILLTGTPLQNNLDELFMLMHFLDAGKFASLEEFQEEFKDINQEEQISRLHKMLAPHLLRNRLQDGSRDLWNKIYAVNYTLYHYTTHQISLRAGGLGINLATADTVIIYDSDWNPHADLQAMARAHRLGQTNKVMIFRLITRGTIEERMMQMTKKKMVLEHLVVGKLKTQNINQEELDDIIRYGSKELFADENDEAGKSRQIHYDDAAIDRLLNRDQVGDEEVNMDEEEEDGFLKDFKVANFEYIDEGEAAAEEEARMASTEIKTTTNNSERASFWEDLLRDKYEVHKVEEFNAMGKGKRSRKQMVSVEDDDLAGLEDVSSDGEDDNYEAELTDGETASSGIPAGRRPYKKKARVNSAEPIPLMEGEGRSFRVLGFNQNQRTAFVQILMRFGVGEYDWAEFAPRLKQKTYEEIKEYSGRMFRLTAHGIYSSHVLFGLIQMVSVEDDDLAGLEDVSSDGEDDNYEAELTDGETASSGIPAGRRPYKKKARVNSAEPIPLMEGEGRSFRVLGFNQNQRTAFVQILMRFGVGEYDWAEFAPRLKQKTYEEIKEYGRLFLSHIAEDITDSLTFTDGVPKEGLRIQDVLVRLAQLMLIRDKVKYAPEKPGSPLFADDIVSRLPGLKSGRFWKEQHDLLLLRAVLKHGYGRWQAIVDDKDLRVQEVICQELNLPFITLPVPGASQTQDGSNMASTETHGSQTTGTGAGNNLAVDATPAAPDATPGGPDAANRAQIFQDSSVLYHFREMQRRQVEFIKKRVLLLEKALTAEYQKEVFGDEKPNETPGGEPETEAKVIDIPSPCTIEIDAQTINHLPEIDVITAEEISAAACDDHPDRLEMARLYNEMCKVLVDNANESVEAYLAKKPAGFQLRKNLLPIETIYQGINRILSPVQQNSFSSEQQIPDADSEMEAPTKIAEPDLPSTLEGDDHKAGAEATGEIKVPTRDAEPDTELDLEKEKCNTECDVAAANLSPTDGTGDDVEMEENQHDADGDADGPTNESTEKPVPGVMVLDD
ncbi:CHD3-type chromatin-remodeling factor PICKLE like [Actinidia chinensis var. chinensis]|uniref:CHD3-type chromatin-remodeling factor PICKLE like n=1 Tax=Actinidia chinensis var. chinensis TaxID=1590841 RepID=A0A2R6QMP8_ACTCC|nr:CHD3-type chromatin-remodeling factor PICKLE like [Actinidia chinensis var. chinensis]